MRSLDSSEIAGFLRSSEIDRQWNAVAPRLADLCQIEDGQTGAVNPGDRRALFYLVKALEPANILEIGSHVGGSTVHIGAAMSPGSSLITVDIHDVNDAPAAAWRAACLPRSPRQMLSELNESLDVRFVKSDSVAFLDRTDQRFDLIFLDGDHSTEVVLEELPRSLRILKTNGVILLHDYFPHGQPLWSNGNVVPGPFEATEKLRKQGTKLKVIPFGTLPWTTKLGSHVTSLAIVVRDQ
jgi:predicted O-methyltransferase YrrM